MAQKQKDITSYDWIAVRPSKCAHNKGYVDVVGFFEYPEYSVLAGQTGTVYIDTFATQDEAFNVYPEAKDTGCAAPVSLTHLPCEDDPVSGDMYPDDI